jgi:molybdate transport system regulatory protein
MVDHPSLSVRVVLRPDTLLGPGKADLLEAVDATGSIAAAGRRLGMSYKRAWYLIDTINRYFKEPVVVSTKGGKTGGGARLTETGHDVLRCYRRIEADAAKVAVRNLAVLASLARRRRA